MESMMGVLGAQDLDAISGIVGIGIFGVMFVILIGTIVGMYMTFSKMGYSDAWWIIIPILNILFLLKVADKPMWWIVLFFVPCVSAIVGLYVGWLVAEKVATAYGKGTGFAVGLLLLGVIFYPYLGFLGGQPKSAA